MEKPSNLISHTCRRDGQRRRLTAPNTANTQQTVQTSNEESMTKLSLLPSSSLLARPRGLIAFLCIPTIQPHRPHLRRDEFITVSGSTATPRPGRQKERVLQVS